MSVCEAEEHGENRDEEDERNKGFSTQTRMNESSSVSLAPTVMIPFEG